MELVDKQVDGAFGKFFGHPDGESQSKRYVLRLLKEFGLTFDYFKDLILSVPVPTRQYVTALQEPLLKAFTEKGWISKPKYPESVYEADFGYRQDKRWIFVEVELSDIRRAVNAFYMARVFRTGYMRLGIFIATTRKALICQFRKNTRFVSSFLSLPYKKCEKCARIQ